MIKFPRALHRHRRFAHGGKLYVADLDAACVIEITQVIWDILELCDQYDNDQVTQALLSIHQESDIISAFGELEQISNSGLLFGGLRHRKNSDDTSNNRLQIFVLASKSILGAANMAAGSAVAALHRLKALSKYADIYLISDSDDQFSDGIYGTPFDYQQFMQFPFSFRNKYDGVFHWDLTDKQLAYLFAYADIPIITELYYPRGSGGNIINGILLLYALMRDYDAFICPSHSIRTFYSKFVHDTSRFFVVHCGVDSDHFRPMDKRAAKREVSEILGRKKVAEEPVVGFFGRFQPEKGAAIYSQIASMNPDLVFLIIAPTMHCYDLRELPKNVIYAGRQTREKLPLFINAFDILCFPSVVGQESFGMAVLESMACGVPPVVPNLDGVPEVVGECGVLVEAHAFDEEVGSFAGWVSPEKISKAIRNLIADEGRRVKLGDRARKRSLSFTWDGTAQKIIRIFHKLNSIKDGSFYPGFPVLFTPYMGSEQGKVNCKSLLINSSKTRERPLMFPFYEQTIADGLAISLLRQHRQGEVESVLQYLLSNSDQVNDVMKRICAFRHYTSEGICPQ